MAWATAFVLPDQLIKTFKNYSLAWYLRKTINECLVQLISLERIPP